MKHLIILRGPAGSGKTTVCEAIVHKLGEGNACVLDLDITYPNENIVEKTSKDA